MIAPLRHKEVVRVAAFIADERRILSWSVDGTAQLWDAASGEPVIAPLRQPYGVDGAVFSADGRRMLTWSADGTARLWAVPKLPKDNLFSMACQMLPHRDLPGLAERYGMKITDPICAEPPPAPDWSRIE